MIRSASRSVILRACTADGAQVIIVDIHAEATREKQAMGWYLNGRVSAVLGSHTHVQTADERILPGGTAFITDAGMTGPRDGIIGMDKDAVIARFVTGLPGQFETASGRSAPEWRGDHRRPRHRQGDRESKRISLSELELAALTDSLSAGSRA